MREGRMEGGREGWRGGREGREGGREGEVERGTFGYQSQGHISKHHQRHVLIFT